MASFRLPANMKSLSLLSAAAAPPPSTISVRAISSGGGGSRRQRAYDGLLLDAGGTLLQPASPVEETYATIGTKYGLSVTESEIKQGFKMPFQPPGPRSFDIRVMGGSFGGFLFPKQQAAHKMAII